MNAQRLWSGIQTPLLLIVLLAVVLGVANVGDLTIARVATMALVSVVFVCGLSVFSGNSGIMSFGHVAFMAIGAYTTAYLTIPVPLKKALFSDLPSWAGFLLDVHMGFVPAVLVSGVAACVLGLVSSPAIARLSGLQSGIASLAILMIVFNVLNSWTSVTRGSSSMIGIPKSTTVGLAFAFAAGSVVLAWLYKRSRSGVQLQASREDYWAAAATGIAVGRHRAMAWVASSFFCGVAGSLYAGMLTTFNVRSFFLTATFAFIVMIVVGGYLSLSGAVIGALGVSVLQEVLRRLQDGQFTGGSSLPGGIADLILAAVLLIVLIKAPFGLMGVRELRIPGRRKTDGPTKGAERVDPDPAESAPVAG